MFSALPLNADILPSRPHVSEVPTSGLSASQQNTVLFDHLVGLHGSRYAAEYRLNLRSKTIHSVRNSNADPGGDEAVFNATPKAFGETWKVGRFQSAASLILK
jgi:hypothetical protein